MTGTPLWHDAAALAARAHRHQVRRDGETPYIAHPARVALRIAVDFGFREEAIIAAALLHDVIEDCGVDRDEIAEQLGEEVAEFVARMSKDARLPHDDRERKYDEQLATGPWQARLIKLADVYDNLLDSHDRGRAADKVDKARRAVGLAQNDPQLERPCRLVLDLIESLERQSEAAAAR